ncbi:MAG: CPBP family intramembrane metalloprotease [Candidatus Eremiobacteraeota bacterium]|nr:CPBP family intramembrane metalloprotease [Candidatus Eremiobacteraeota bacterium]MCW5869465.1 CPBP family intramembrane metalloprotease [Candidatus Eremiobacteraeota bacterium]
MWTLFYYELRHILRDITQLLVVALLIPLLLTPFVGNSFQRALRQSEALQSGTFFVAVVGPRAQEVRALLPQLGKFKEMPLTGSPGEALRENLVDCFITVEDAADVDSPGDWRLEPLATRSRLAETPRLTVHYNQSRERSQRAQIAFSEGVGRYLSRTRDRYLSQLGIEPKRLYQVHSENLASRRQEQVQLMASLVPIVLIFVLFGTGSVTALDAVAGERERGSLATLLVSALDRRTIAGAKWLTVVVISLTFGLPQLLGLLWNMRGLGGHSLALLSPGSWFCLFFFCLLLCLQVSAVLLWISARSSTFKQAQLLYMPGLLVTGALAAVSWMQALPLRSVMVLVPISGLSLALRDSLLEDFSLWLLLAAAASLCWTLFLLRSVADNLTLDLLDKPHSDVPVEQMRRSLSGDILWYYALAGALMVVVPGNLPILSGLRGQVALIQTTMLFLPLVLLRIYRQPLRPSLRWRNTSLSNWTICLLAAPLMHLCANSVAIISSWLLPMSEEAVRQMTQLLLPKDASQLELFFLIAVCPAFCEEMAFRGGLLHAVQQPRDRLHPSWRTCLLVGLAFGAFHFSVQRILPTAVIGSLLTYVALKTNSIWPCMMLHLVNNALAVFLSSLAIDYTQLPGWGWIAAWILLLYLLKRLAGVGPDREEREASETTAEA